MYKRLVPSTVPLHKVCIAHRHHTTRLIKLGDRQNINQAHGHVTSALTPIILGELYVNSADISEALQQVSMKKTVILCYHCNVKYLAHIDKVNFHV
jgi:hypothetical protein